MKTTDTDDKKPRDTKNHAGGGNERQDAYLYGHPGGRKKRYRSPAEFFPHLLWLATDEAGDTNNCSCKFCSPEELDTDKTKDVTAPIKSQEPVKTTAKTQPAMVRKTSSTAARASPLPRQRCLEQKQDQRYNEFHYRPGELVWFCRGQAWGIGVVMQREHNQQNNTRMYMVQPLSHPTNPTTIVKNPQDQIRNWLAWSPPPLTHSQLNPSESNGNKVWTFENVNWPDVSKGKYGRGDVPVDSSILAAKMVETTYTLFDRIEAKASNSGSSQVSELYYNGMYFGGEKIWLGDPLRLRTAPTATTPSIFVLQSIIERSPASNSTRATIHLVGDSYSMASCSPSAPPPSESLPPRVLEDLRIRNTITSRNSDTTKRHFTWALLTAGMRVGIADVKGRWYESTLFTPILDPAAYNTGKANGELLEAGLFMNGQGDCNRPPGGPPSTFKPADVKTKRREDAFGRSVPTSFSISKGLDADVYGKQTTSSTGGGQLGSRGPTPVPAAARQVAQQIPVRQSVMPTSQQQIQYQEQQRQQQIQAPSNFMPQQLPYQQDSSAQDDGGAFDQYMQFDDTEMS